MKLKFRETLIFIFFLGLLVRLYKINTPLADWHSFRQADTASVTREFIKHGIDLLHPHYQDLSNIQSGMQNQGQDNTQGWRMVEFPIVNGVLAQLLRTFPSLDLVVTSRLASVFASLVSLVCLALLVRRVYGSTIALASAFFFATLPYSIYYSRTILPEPFFIAASLVSLYLFEEWYRKKNIWLGVSSAAFFSLALLIKPMAIFFTPVFLAIWYMNSKKIRVQELVVAGCFILSAIPLYLWRHWILQFPLGIPASDWLYNGGGPQYALSPVYRVRFRPAWFRWLFYERLTKLFLGYVGQLFFVGGAVVAFKEYISKKYALAFFYLAFAVGSLGYLIVFAAGNVQHDYYQAPLVPYVSLSLGLGVVYLYGQAKKHFKQTGAVIACGMCLILMYFFAWNQVKGYYNINNWDIVAAGKAADAILPADSKVIAPYQGDTAFLFQINRTGWPIGFDIDKKISEGAQYYISVNYDDEARQLEKKYDVIEKTDKYIIIDLTKKK